MSLLNPKKAKQIEERYRWLSDTKYNSFCAECEQEVNIGDKVLWDMKTGRVYCKDCGEDID